MRTELADHTNEHLLSPALCIWNPDNRGKEESAVLWPQVRAPAPARHGIRKANGHKEDLGEPSEKQTTWGAGYFPGCFPGCFLLVNKCLYLLLLPLDFMSRSESHGSRVKPKSSLGNIHGVNCVYYYTLFLTFTSFFLTGKFRFNGRE